MRPFVLKQHDVTSNQIRELKVEELGQVAGGMQKKCPGDLEDSITGAEGSSGDGCDEPGHSGW